MLHCVVSKHDGPQASSPNAELCSTLSRAAATAMAEALESDRDVSTTPLISCLEMGNEL